MTYGILYRGWLGTLSLRGTKALLEDVGDSIVYVCVCVCVCISVYTSLFSFLLFDAIYCNTIIL